MSRPPARVQISCPRIWDLHEKHRQAEDYAYEPHDHPRNKGPNPIPTGRLKREATMTFRRLRNAVMEHVGGDEEKMLELMRQMNAESNKRSQ